MVNYLVATHPKLRVQRNSTSLQGASSDTRRSLSSDNPFRTRDALGQSGIASAAAGGTYLVAQLDYLFYYLNVIFLFSYCLLQLW